MISRVTLKMASTVGLGIAFGPSTPYHDVTSISGTPASARVGTLGVSGLHYHDNWKLPVPPTVKTCCSFLRLATVLVKVRVVVA